LQRDHVHVADKSLLALKKAKNEEENI